MLRVEQAVVEFGGSAAVDGVDLEVGEAETIAILGPSGCGKSTLLRAIAGLQPLTRGRISWDGEDLAPVPPHRRRFGLMFQEYALFPHRDVAGNVGFGLRMARAGRSERRRRVSEVLDLVGLAGLADRRVSGLSGGEQQRVALARAIAVEPRLLMLDEPLGALDRPWRERLLREIRSLLDRTQLPAIYVTHDHEEAFALADRLAVMRGGRIVQSGVPSDVWRRPADLWTAEFLGFGPVVRAEIDAAGLRTPWGTVPVNRPVAGTARVSVVLRPDAVRLDAAGPVRGQVVRRAFAGDRAELTVLANGVQLRVRVADRDAPGTGDAIRLSIESDGVLVYPAD